jgi:hypothetical protein
MFVSFRYFLKTETDKSCLRYVAFPEEFLKPFGIFGCPFKVDDRYPLVRRSLCFLFTLLRASHHRFPRHRIIPPPSMGHYRVPAANHSRRKIFRVNP